MRKLDFAIQTVLLGLAVAFLVSGVIFDKGFFILIGMAQFFLGCQQLLSAIVTTFNSKGQDAYRRKNTRLYWILVAVYFTVLAVLYFTCSELIGLIWFCSAWGIAIYYYVFTIQLAFGRNEERRSFLDIAN